jgi:hypothetical protein
MPDVITASFDLSGVNALTRGIQQALIGMGHEGDATVLVTQSAKLLSWECSRQLGPKTEGKGKSKIARDLMKVFHPMVNSKTGSAWDIFDDPKDGGNNGTTWLYAGPTYLVGVKNEDYFPDAEESALEAIYNREGRGGSTRGVAWKDQGVRRDGFIFKGKYRASHGRQHVFLLDRIAVKKTPFNALLKKLAGRVGRMRATFAYCAAQFGMTGIPQWISKQFDSVAADGRAIFDKSALEDPVRPTIVFGSRAPGISKFKEKIDAAIKRREKQMATHLRLILNGYVQDANAHRPIKRRAKQISFTE